MSANSKIEWTHHTFNPWWGCVKVSDGCKNCYADTFSHRLGLKIWGQDADRRFFKDAHWQEPVKWNRDAEKSGARARVFCASMGDVGEDRRDLDTSRARLMRLIEVTPMLDWLLLSKRPENYTRLFSWGATWPENVWAGTSVENQSQTKRIIDLLKCPAAVRFLSCEPLLGNIILKPYLTNNYLTRCPGSEAAALPCVDWVIVGGESGPGARPCDLSWIRSIVKQCKDAGVACFCKQLGSKPVAFDPGCGDEFCPDAPGYSQVGYRGKAIADSKGGDIEEWPEDLRIRQFPRQAVAAANE